MADNVAITAGAGVTIRSDDVGGVQTQVFKLALGGDGVEDLLLDSGQQTMAASLPVTFASDQTFPMIAATDVAFAGQITVTTAGVPAQGTSIACPNGFMVKCHPDNTDTIWVFAFGQTKANGFPLNTGEAVVLNITNLSQAGFDADVSGEKVCWIKL